MPYDLAPADHAEASADAVIAALLDDGDSRIRPERTGGLNKYLCPAAPAPEMVCFASCTASPITPAGFAAAAAAWQDLTREAVATQPCRIAAQAQRIEARLLRYFGVASLAKATLFASGTDALAAVAEWLAAERPGQPLTMILPEASETGSGVGLAMTGHAFDGPQSGRKRLPATLQAVTVALRDAAGQPRPVVAVATAFAAAARAARDRAVVVLTHGSKTGLIAPLSALGGCEVVVDACQARIAPATVVAYLRRGWPVVVTGSKFFGGPAFSGAVLWPAARARPAAPPPGLGTLLRWTAALHGIETFAAATPSAATQLRRWTELAVQALADVPGAVPVGGLPPHGADWAEQPSIVTFALRDPREPARMLSADGLRPLYRSLAERGVLVGQPVGLGGFGGLRLAAGARDLTAGPSPDAFARLREALSQAARGA